VRSEFQLAWAVPAGQGPDWHGHMNYRLTINMYIKFRREKIQCFKESRYWQTLRIFIFLQLAVEDIHWICNMLYVK
jgi:hypothetical protein